jgi:hypothetical protein
MERVIEFPRPKAPAKEAKFPKTDLKKVINIAEWIRKQQRPQRNANVHSWPFCSA